MSVARGARSQWIARAWVHFPQADRIEDEGRYAVVTACRPGYVIVRLYETEAAAKAAFTYLEENECGGRCGSFYAPRWHRLVDLQEQPTGWPPEDHGNPPYYETEAYKAFARRQVTMDGEHSRSGGMKLLTAREWIAQGQAWRAFVEHQWGTHGTPTETDTATARFTDRRIDDARPPVGGVGTGTA